MEKDVFGEKNLESKSEEQTNVKDVEFWNFEAEAVKHKT